MKRKYGSALAVLAMLMVISGGLSANANQSNAIAGKPQPQATSAKPSVAEPNPSWHDQYPDYYKVRMASATDGWIVGAEGAIRRYAGGQWVAYVSPVTTTLRSVYPISNTAFAVGNNNVIMQFSNDAWQVTPGPSGCANFRDVWMISPSDGWAVGSTCAITPIAVLAHFNGSAWQSTTVPTNTTSLNAVQMISSTEGWAVGNAGIILHYTDGSWQPVNGGNSNNAILSIAMLPDGSEGWAGSSSTTCVPATTDTFPPPTLHYANGVWSNSNRQPAKAQSGKPDPCLSKTAYAFGVTAIGAASRWYVGSYDQDSTGTGAEQFNGLYGRGAAGTNDWDSSNVIGPDPLYSVYMLGGNDVWAVGSSGYSEHYNGTEWQQISGAPLASNGLAYNSGSNSLIQVGNVGIPTGGILVTSSVDGSTVLSCTTNLVSWRAVASLESSNLEAWAVGLDFNGMLHSTQQGKVAHITSAGCSTSTVMTNSLNSVVAVSPTLAVAVGDNGGLAVYNGSWITTTLGTEGLNAIAYNGGRFWAVGGGGAIYTTSGDPANPADWNLINASADSLNSVSAISNNEAWAVGNGVHYHIIGNTASRDTSPYNLSSVYMRSDTDGWAVGFDGAIEHYDGYAWASVSETGIRFMAVAFTPEGQGWISGNGFPPGIEPNLFRAYNIPGYLLHFAPACYDYYTDVPPDYYARQYILDLSCRGIVSGMGGHIYAPAANATRIQFAKIISLARGWPIITPTSPTFSDVPSTNPLYAFVEAAYANGAISGADAATCQARGIAFPCFLPNGQISRAQAVVITVRAFGWPIDTTGGPHFSDVSPDNYAYGAVETAYNRGVVSGVGGGLFAPNASVTRAQIAKIVDLALTNP